MGNMVTDVYVMFYYDQLHIDTAWGNFCKPDNKNKNDAFRVWKWNFWGT